MYPPQLAAQTNPVYGLLQFQTHPHLLRDPCSLFSSPNNPMELPLNSLPEPSISIPPLTAPAQPQCRPSSLVQGHTLSLQAALSLSASVSFQRLPPMNHLKGS